MGSAARRAVDRGRSADRDSRPARPARREEPTVPRTWGGVARRGARVVGEPAAGSASRAWRDAIDKDRDRDRDRAQPPAWTPEVWIEEPDGGAPSRPRKPQAWSQAQAQAQTQAPKPAPRGRGARLPAPVKDELGRANRRVAPKLEHRLAEAVRAYQHDRYQDARRILRPLAEAAPGAAAVRELHGLTLYRMNRWIEARKELEAFHALTGSYDQHPVLMDCCRALKRWSKVESLWADLREASPGADIVSEGRIVAAGAMADRGRLAEGIHLLDRAPTDVKRPKLHHLRTWYALADLHERAGDIPRARALFTAVLRQDADFADVGERLAGLG
ncbi:MAG: hypothetical protein QOI20_1409 [Acidimicrobiaceae bacterium]|nr:hypothetical protein [Acidimicrobiaceae bacterium]